MSNNLIMKVPVVFEISSDSDSDFDERKSNAHFIRVRSPKASSSNSSSSSNGITSFTSKENSSVSNKTGEASAIAWKKMMELMQKNQKVDVLPGNQNKIGKVKKSGVACGSGRNLKRIISQPNQSCNNGSGANTGNTDKHSDSLKIVAVVTKKPKIDKHLFDNFKNDNDENNSDVAVETTTAMGFECKARSNSLPVIPEKKIIQTINEEVFPLFKPKASKPILKVNGNGNDCWNQKKIEICLNNLNNNEENLTNGKKRQCPFYKKIPDTAFSVDAFNYGVIPGIDVYYLSHFHSDHYIGLTKKFSKTLICSPATGNLVKMKIGVSENCIRKLDLNTMYCIQGIDVILVDANHCPGSVMFIFRLPNGKIIFHTGDFRFTPDMLTNPFVLSLPKVDCLYLDTTYCDPKYDFPSQTDAIAQVLETVKRHIAYRPKTLIVCGAYCIGKERVFFTLAEVLNLKVFCEVDKRRVMRALETPEFLPLLDDSEPACSIHVLPMRNLNPTFLGEYLAKNSILYNNIIAVKPTGWEFSRTGTGMFSRKYLNDTVTIIGVPYSEHSSFSELKEFVSTLKPIKVQPTVGVGSEPKRATMSGYINKWLGFKQ